MKPGGKHTGTHNRHGIEKVMILGAAGRDFHDFQVYWSVRPDVEVVCFTGTQIPGIDGRLFPPELCHNDHNHNLYPKGINIFDEANMESLIHEYQVDTVALAYSDLRYDTVQSLAARANTCGCQFVQLPPKLTMLVSTKPVLAVCASRTGVGKSQTTRAIAQYYKAKGYKVAVVRHPMPYDRDILSQRCQRYETLDDMDRYKCTIEEREEYYPHIVAGTLLFAGVDYEMILRQAEKDADIVIWDGGNNDVPFYKPDVHLTLVDALRPGHENHYYPGEINVRMANAILIAKVNALPNMDAAIDQAKALRALTKAPVLCGNSVVTSVTDNAAELVQGKRVLVVDDGPTLTHGGMSYGAGYVLANQLGASTIIDPRPFAKGSLIQVFAKFPHLTQVLPAMGYSAEQIQDLSATINAAECDVVVLGTPSGIVDLLHLKKPTVVARYDLQVVDTSLVEFEELLDSVVEIHNKRHPETEHSIINYL
jgi:predicted GTPase